MIMNKILTTIIGDFADKKEYRQNEARAKALPKEYAHAYREIKKYIFGTSGILSMQPLISLVDIFEEAAANNRPVAEVTGENVAEFADELVKGEKSWQDTQRAKLNKNLGDK